MGYKKILTIILIFVIILPFFFKKEEQKKEFTLQTVQLRAPAGDLIKNAINEFKQKHKDYEVIWVDIPIGEAQKRTIASILGGNPPDLININPEYSVSLAQKNTLEFFDKKDTEGLNQNLVNKLKYEDKIYALPFYATSAVSILNKEKLKGCRGEIKTYDDISKLDKCYYKPVFGISLNEGDTFSKILNKYGIGEKNLDPEKTEEVYLKFEKMKNDGHLLKDTLTINHREAVEKYMAGSASIINAGSNFISTIEQNAPDVYKNSVVLPQLTGSNGKYDISIMNLIIPKRAKNKELALEFAKILVSEDFQLEFSKKTNVLPANQKALQNKRFKSCKADLADKARCIAAYQLQNPLDIDFGYKNKKEINETVNKSLETLFLQGYEDFRKAKTADKIQNFVN